MIRFVADRLVASGILSLCLLVGCTPTPTSTEHAQSAHTEGAAGSPATSKASAKSPRSHSHAHGDGQSHGKGHSHGADEHSHEHGPGHAHGAGPHGGTLADWGGGKFHVEFVVDHKTQTATVYVLGTDEKTPAPIQPADGKLLLTITSPVFQVDLAAQPLDDETGGAASRFVGQHASLAKEQEFAGTISAEINGTPYAGDFAEAKHDHSHDHGDEHHDHDGHDHQGK